MDRSKKKFSGSHEVSKKGPPLGLVIALAAAGGVVVGSAGTYYLSKPHTAPTQAASPAAGGTPQGQTIVMPPPQAQQFTPAPQPPGEVPPGKVWSVEHGHWHDAPTTVTIPVPATATPTPETTPAAVPTTVTPAPAAATPTPAPTTTPVPAEKKE